MVSLNYRNNVLKKIINEKFDSNEYKEQISKITRIIEKIKNPPYSDTCYVLELEDELVSVLVPRDQVTYIKTVNADDYNELKASHNIGISTPIDLNNPKDEEGYFCCFPFYKLIIDISQVLNYSIEDKCMVFAYSKNVPSRNPAELMKNSKYNRITTLDDLKTVVKDATNKIFNNDRPSKIIDKETLKSKSKELRIFNKNEINSTEDSEGSIGPKVNEKTDEATKNKIKNRVKNLYNYGRKKKVFTPENLVGDNSFRSVPTLQSKVSNSLEIFDKTAMKSAGKFLPQLLVSAILENIVKNPFQSVEITPKIFSTVPHMMDKYQKSGIDDFIKDNQNKNLLQSVDNEGITLAKNLLLSDPNEIISSIALLQMGKGNIKWSQNSNGQSAKDELMAIFGSEADFSKGSIAFPMTSNEPLVDSYAMITSAGKSRELGISTKGGVNGLGSAASITSLFKFLFDDNSDMFNEKSYYNSAMSEGLIKASYHKGELEHYISTYIVPKLSRFGQGYWNQKPELLSYIIIFGAVKASKHDTIIKNMIKNGIMNTKFKTEINSSLMANFAEEVTSRGLTDIVMSILDKQKYKFCQINTKPTFVGNTFKWEYEVQYPARFSGEVRFEKNPSNNSLRFHIMGSVK